jgi:hypothetical protein
MVLYRRGILELPKPREIQLSTQIMNSTESIKPVKVRWKASGALNIKLYQNGELIEKEFRPSDEYETQIDKTTNFKIIADYGNGEIVEKESQNPENKRVDFELVKGKKGKGTTIQIDDGEYDPDTTTTISRGVGRCQNCGNVIDNEFVKKQAQAQQMKHKLYAVASKIKLGAAKPHQRGQGMVKISPLPTI